MSAQTLIRKMREHLVSWGLVAKPRFYLNRHAAGAVRNRLTGRGSSRRMRRLSLRRLLEQA